MIARICLFNVYFFNKNLLLNAKPTRLFFCYVEGWYTVVMTRDLHGLQCLDYSSIGKHHCAKLSSFVYYYYVYFKDKNDLCLFYCQKN